MKQSTYLRKVINALKNAGWVLVGVDDGDGKIQKVNSTKEAMDAVSAVEDAHLFFEKRGADATAVERSQIHVVWQGPDDDYEEGEEIVSDYGMKLDPVISSISSGENPPRKRGRKRAKKTRRNPPPLWGSTKRALKSGRAGTMIGIQVYDIRYRHASDGKDYRHAMTSDDAILIGLPDGSILIESASGKRLWNLFDV